MSAESTTKERHWQITAMTRHDLNCLVIELELQLESAKDVLGFYGNTDHYVKLLSEKTTPIRADKGKRARKWIEENK